MEERIIYGDGVSRGYIGDHDEENKAFEKLSDGSVMYRSGDLGYIQHALLLKPGQKGS